MNDEDFASFETDSTAGPGMGDPARHRDQQLRARPVPRITIQAFCEDQETSATLENVGKDRRFSKAHVTVQMGGVPAAVSFYQQASSPNLIIVESVYDREPMLADIDRLANVCDAGTKVVVIGHVNDVVLYRELMQRGVSEYLVAPVTPLQLMECVSDLFADPDAEPLGRVISFIGARGGAGASTVAHNVAFAMAKEIGVDVAIADFDLPFGTAGLDFNQDPVQGIAEALSAPDRVDAVMLERLLAKCAERLSLCAAPATLEWEYDLDVKSCNKLVDVARQNVPYVVADMPHMWTSWSKKLLVQSDEVVITATPDLASLRNTKNLVELLVEARSHDEPPRLVLNQTGVAKRPEIPVKDFASAVGLKPAAVIGFDAHLFGTAANNGQMVEEVDHQAPAAELFRSLAFLVSNRVAPKTQNKSVLAPLLDKLNIKMSA